MPFKMHIILNRIEVAAPIKTVGCKNLNDLRRHVVTVAAVDGARRRRAVGIIRPRTVIPSVIVVIGQRINVAGRPVGVITA